MSEHGERLHGWEGPAGRQGERGDTGSDGKAGPRGRQGESLTSVTRRAVVVLFALSVAFSAIGLFWISHEATAQEHKWCATLITLDEADHAQPPPATAFGKHLVADFHNLRREFGCG